MIRKKILCFFIAVLFCFGIAAVSFANVSGSGTFTPVMPGTTYYAYTYSGNYYGSINENPGGGYVPFYMDGSYPSYSGSGSLNGSSISGSHDSLTGRQTLSFNAVSHTAGQITYADTDLIGYTSYTGVLDGSMGYDYTFTGFKNDASDPDDRLTFIIQMEIYYTEPDLNNPGWTLYRRAYSDYNPDVLPGGGFRNNWAYHYDVETGTYAGSIRFDFPDFGSQGWVIRWDFMGNGMDTTSGSSNPVPEPATMLLLGFGLVGLAGIRKKLLK